MKHATRSIDPAEARDLLERVPRACVAFARDNIAQTEPVTLVFKDDRYLVGISASAPAPAVGQEIVLLVDEGCQFFDLRAIYVRGHVGALDVEMGAPGDLFWCAVVPMRVVAWDYGRMRRVDDTS